MAQATLDLPVPPFATGLGFDVSIGTPGSSGPSGLVGQLWPRGNPDWYNTTI